MILLFMQKNTPPKKKFTACQTVVTWPLCGWNLAIPQTSCSRWKFLFKVKWKDCMRSWGLDHVSSWSSHSTLSFGLPRHQQHSSFCALSIFVMLNFDWLMSGIMFLHYNNHSLPVNSHQQIASECIRFDLKTFFCFLPTNSWWENSHLKHQACEVRG